MDVQQSDMAQKALRYLSGGSSKTASTIDESLLFPIIMAVVVVVLILFFKMFRKY